MQNFNDSLMIPATSSPLEFFYQVILKSGKKMDGLQFLRRLIRIIPWAVNPQRLKFILNFCQSVIFICHYELLISTKCSAFLFLVDLEGKKAMNASLVEENPSSKGVILMAHIQEEKPKNVDEGMQEVEERSTWDNPLEFVLSCLGYAVGLGNVWRFPYLCYRNGGGAFLVTYFIMLFLIGMPIFMLELVVGQYSGLGPVEAFANLAPIFHGLGYCMLMVITLVSIYYMVIVAWTIFYFFASFTTELRFGTCHNDFNTIGCFSASEEAKCAADEIYYAKKCTAVADLCRDYGFAGAIGKTHCIISADNNNSIHIKNVINRTLSTQEYFRDYVLGIKDATWDNYGAFRWELFLCLTLCWVVAYLCVIRGVKTSGKVAYFTALFPYVILTALVIQGAMLDGAEDGLILYLKPRWEKLLEVDVWANAASQTFYSFGIAAGSLITLASYSKFDNNCVKDVMILTAANTFTSIYAGLAIFAMLGFLAKQMGVSVEEVAQDGPGLAFVAYPEAILRLPAPTVWALLFFFMLFILGLGCQFAGIEAISCLILDKWPGLRAKQVFVRSAICVGCFLCGIPMCWSGGIYLFTLLEWNTASWAVFLIGLAELAVVSWAYGCDRFLDDMTSMGMTLSKPSRWYWWICLTILTPLTLFAIFVFQMANFSLTYYEDYVFPLWADSLGWMIGLSTLFPLIVFGIYSIQRRKYSGWQLFRATAKWRPQIGKTENSSTLTTENNDQLSSGTGDTNVI